MISARVTCAQKLALQADPIRPPFDQIERKTTVKVTNTNQEPLVIRCRNCDSWHMETFTDVKDWWRRWFSCETCSTVVRFTSSATKISGGTSLHKLILPCHTDERRVKLMVFSKIAKKLGYTNLEAIYISWSNICVGMATFGASIRKRILHVYETKSLHRLNTICM